MNGTPISMSKEKHITSEKIKEAYFRMTVRYSGLFKALAPRAWHSTDVRVDSDRSETAYRNQVAEAGEITESLKSRVHLTQPVLDHLKDQ